MAVNRFSNILQGPSFKARSLQETLIAPMALRESHDATVNALESNLTTAMQAEVGEEYGEQFGEYLKQYEQGTEALINDINTSGINTNAVLDKFGTMKRKMDKDFSNQGVVGKLVNLNNRVKEANDNSIKLAIQQGQSPEWASEVAKRDRAAFYENLPKDLKDIRGEFGEYKPTLAPKYTDVVKEFTPIMNIMGSISDSLSSQGIRTDNYQIVPDGNGIPQLIGYDKITNTSKSVDVSNEPQLANAVNMLWNMQKNPNSPLMQNLRYLGHDVDNLLDTIRGLQGVASRTVSEQHSIDNLEFVPVGGGRVGGGGRTSTVKAGKEEEPNTSDIILEQPTSGMTAISNKDALSRLQEINSLPPSEITPEVTRERNNLMLKKSLIDKEINTLTENKYLVNGKLNKSIVPTNVIQEIQGTNQSLFNKDKINKTFDNFLNEYTQLAENSSTGDPSRMAGKVNQIKQILSNPNVKLSEQDVVSIIETTIGADAREKEGKLTEFGKPSEAYNKLLSTLKPLVNIAPLNDRQIARVLAEREVQDLNTANTLQTFNVSSLNAISAIKDPQEARGFSNSLRNLVMNASGGGNIALVTPEGDTDINFNLSNVDKQKEIKSIINTARDINIVAFDVGVNETNIRFDVTNKDEETHQLILPLRTTNGKIPEEIDAIFGRLIGYGTQRDAERLNTIRDAVSTNVHNQPIPIDTTLTRGDKSNYNREFPNISSTTLEAARQYNANGILMGDTRQRINSQALPSKDYPYNRTDLEMIGNFVVNKGNQGNFYTTKYRVKGTDEGQYEYFNFDNYIETSLNKRLPLLGTINESTNKAVRNELVGQTFDLIASGKLTGVTAMDTHELRKIQTERTAKLKQIAEKYSTGNTVNNLESRKVEMNNEIYELNQSYNSSLKNIPVAASHKKYLL